MMVPAFSSRGSVPEFMQCTVTSRLVQGLSRVAATATPFSSDSRLATSSTGLLCSEFGLQLMCASRSGGKVSVLVTWTLLANRRPIWSVLWMVLSSITSSPLSQTTEPSAQLKNFNPRMALSDMRQTMNRASNGTFLSRPDKPMFP